jgi:parallel beta-helix repeat protein
MYLVRSAHCHRSVRTVITFAILSILGSAFARAGTVTISPGANIPSIVSSSPAGTTFVISPGVYRLQTSINPQNGDVFTGPCAKPPCAAGSQAILSGSHLLTSFQLSGGYYSAGGQTQQNTVTIPSADCNAGYAGCIYPEDLFFDGAPLIHVTSLSAVGTGSWYFDYATHTVYLSQNPSGHTVEVGAVPAAFTPGPANNVTIQGLTIEEFATPVMTGAVAGAYTGYGSPSLGANWIVQNNEILLNHADGIRLNFGWQVLNNYIHDNGDLGIGGGIGGGNADGTGTTASNILIQGNEIANNNYAEFRTDWGAAGSKVLESTGVVFRGNYVHGNKGPGFHTDTANYNAVYENNIVEDNAKEGILHEISYAATIRNNKLLRNGYTIPNGTDWLFSGNLVSSTSQGVEAYCNTAEVSATGGNGLDILTQTRTSFIPSINNYYHHNTVFFDGNSGVTGGARGEPTNSAEQNFFTANKFDYNTYHLPSLSYQAFAWADKNNTFAQFQAEGQDVHGAADTNYTGSYPTVSITTPAEGSTVSGIVNVAGNIQDTSPISKVEIYVDWVLEGTTTGNAFDYSLNTSQISNGQHVLAAMAVNTEGVQTCYGVNVNVTEGSSSGQYLAVSTPVTGTPDARTITWSGFPNGSGVIVDATQVGNSITFTLNVPSAGSYDVKVSTKNFSTRGIGQLSVNGANLGTPMDQYTSNAAGVFEIYDLGTVSLSAGNSQFKFTVTGKDAGSSSYSMAFDYIQLTAN